MTELPSVVVTPREELRVPAVDVLKVCARPALPSDYRCILLHVVMTGLVPPYVFGRAYGSLFVQVIAIGLALLGV